MTATVAPRASSAEKDRLRRDFVRLCEIESPSGREREIVDVLLDELRAAGLDPQEDASAAETGANAGNVMARIDGPVGARTIMLCAHVDTVPLAGPIEVEERDGVLTNRHEAILGADNKAAVAAILGVARRHAAEPPPVGLDLVFTTSEEPGLRGAKALDLGQLRSEFGFVFDHASPIGDLIVAAPTYYRIEGHFRGKAAHAGIRPEDGRNAIVAAAAALASIRLGRLDEGTTANVGRIDGGTAANVVAERCRVELEARSLDHERAGEVVAEIVDALTASASDTECDVELEVQEQFRAYRLPRSAPVVQAAVAALAGVGIEASCIATGGGSDAHAFQARGLPCLNVANGTERNHQPDECVTVYALETMLDATLGIVAHSA
ncbi:MAG: M20/M25/M40 family metallo-hydrolase [Actinobacteria bacterium]|nr:MAG: M20/M25/M40 family metallo-hydrolase [Actinomycetota bacterium]